MDIDFILNGKANGGVAATLLQNEFNVGVLRPYIGSDGRSYVTSMEGGKPKAVLLTNANATLRKDEWKIMDDAVVMAAKSRLRAVADLRAAGLTFNIPNGMSKTVLETERMSDISPAVVSMDPARVSEADRPEYELINLPLPVIHKDFYYSARQIAASRNSGASIDTATAELAARRVAEQAEQLLVGSASGITYGGGTVYGWTNFPQTLTKTITAPTAENWTPSKLVQEVLAMRQLSEDKFHYGPWRLYNAPAWDQYLDDDYSSSKGDNTVRQRIEAINGIQAVATSDYLTGWGLVLVQMTSDVVRMVIGMDITTVQWETEGGMRLNFKVMAIMVPQLRADIHGNTGIVYGNTTV
jgi:uncharacterized linocin/CFP29 family protein